MGTFHFTVFKYIFVYKSVSVCEVWLLIITNKIKVSVTEMILQSVLPTFFVLTKINCPLCVSYSVYNARPTGRWSVFRNHEAVTRVLCGRSYRILSFLFGKPKLCTPWKLCLLCATRIYAGQFTWKIFRNMLIWKLDRNVMKLFQYY
jgi:hypothetical protein